MNFRKNSTLIVGLAIAVILLGISIFFLIGNQSAYTESKSALASAKNRLSSLNNRNPFPSAENIKQTETQIESIRTQFVAVMKHLQEGQLKVEPIEPARFAQLLEETSRRIREKASVEGVTLPAEPGLGFKDYVAGKLPPNDPVVMNRLVIQIRAIENIVSLLASSKIASIDAIQRDQFENKLSAVAADQDVDVSSRSRGGVVGRGPSGETRAIPGGIPQAPQSDLYTTERFSIEFTGRESAVWDTLNRFVSSKITYVIVDLNLSNTATGLGKPVDLKSKLPTTTGVNRPVMTGAAGLPDALQPSVESLSREERVVGGRELINVKMVLDMYRFLENESGEVTP